MGVRSCHSSAHFPEWHSIVHSVKARVLKMAFKFPHIWPFQPQLTSLSSVTHLPPATVASLLVREPHVHLAHKCPMAFAQADPSVWNALLPHITELTLSYAMLPLETQSVLVWCHEIICGLRQRNILLWKLVDLVFWLTRWNSFWLSKTIRLHWGVYGAFQISTKEHIFVWGSRLKSNWLWWVRWLTMYKVWWRLQVRTIWWSCYRFLNVC